MKRWIALFRGINVGKAKRVAMADLRRELEGLGHQHVRTLLNSGNAVFDAKGGSAAGHAREIKALLQARLGVDAEVIVKSAADIAAALAEHPLRHPASDDTRLLVMFTQDGASLAALKPLEDGDWAPEAFAVGAHAAWLWCADGVIESRISKAVGKLLAQRGTARNRATLVKLDAMAREETP